MQANNIPHGKYFISHSYRDADVRDEMIAQLPDEVEPFIFPPIQVKPDQYVSTPMLDAVEAQDGLIYLDSEKSRLSAWVTLEVDYARRAEKPVFQYRVEDKCFVQEGISPIDLQVYFSMSAQDQHNRNFKRQIWNFMQNKRHFKSLFQEIGSRGGESLEDWLIGDLKKRIEKGGYMIAFWSEHSSSSPAMELELSFIRDNHLEDRLLVGLLDDTPIPAWITSPSKVIQLYQDTKPSQINANRVDDLIVRLYSLIFRNQFPDLVYT